LEVGVSDPHIAPAIRWVDAVFPFYRGMRDSSKWAAILALAYSQFMPIGSEAVIDWCRRAVRPGLSRELAVAAGIGLVLTTPLYYGNGLLYGMHGQIQPSPYPAGWYAADRALEGDPNPGRSVFLPWHGYL